MKSKGKEVEELIAVMRKTLHELIEKNDNLNELEVIKASQELDKVLNEYNEIIKDMKNKA